MNKTKLFLLILLTILLLFLIGACDCSQNGETPSEQQGEQQTEPQDEVFKLSYTQLDLELYDDFIITAINAKGKVVFSSSDESVATVTDFGKIVSLKVGETTITAISGDQVATCLVRVVDNALVPVMSLEYDSVQLLVGNICKNQATLTFKGAICEGVTYTYTSSDESVAEVSVNGVVKAKKIGSCVVTVSSQFKSLQDVFLTKTFTVNVIDNVSLTIANAETFEIFTAQNVSGEVFATQVQAQVVFMKDDNPYPVESDCYSWEIQNPAIAEVNETGLISAKAEGTTNVKVKYNGADYKLESEWIPVSVRKPVVEVDCEALIDVTDKTLNSAATRLFNGDAIIKIVDLSGSSNRIEYLVIDGKVYGQKYYAGSDDNGNPIEKEKYVLGGDKDIEIHTEKYALKMKGVVATKVITTAAELFKLHEYTKTSRLGTYEGYIVLDADIKVQDSDYNVQYAEINKPKYNNGKFFSCWYDLDLAECAMQACGGSNLVYVYDPETTEKTIREALEKETEEAIQQTLEKEEIESIDQLVAIRLEKARKDKFGKQWLYADGQLDYSGQYAEGFNGTFDGRGHTISNINFFMSGLYVRLGTLGVIKNVAFDKISLVGDESYAICKYNSGTIDNVFVSVKNTVQEDKIGVALCAYLESCGTISNCVIYHTGISSGENRYAAIKESNGGTISNLITITDEDRVIADGMIKFSDFDALMSASMNYSKFNQYWDVSNYRAPVFKGYSGDLIPERAIRVQASATRVGAGDVIKLQCNYDNATVCLKGEYSFADKISINGMTVSIADDIADYIDGNATFNLEVRVANIAETYELPITIVALETVNLATSFGDLEQLSESTNQLDSQIIGEIISVKVSGVQVDFSISGERKLVIPANALKNVQYGEVIVTIETETKIYTQPATLLTKVLRTKEDFANIHSFIKTDTKGVYDGYLVLGNDIDMTGVEYIVPSGYESMFMTYAGLCPFSDADYDSSFESADGFKGILDGRGYSVNNLSIFLYGIFYRNSGTIRNISIASKFQREHSATIALYNEGIIDNVFILVEVSDNIATYQKPCYGVVRDNNGTISNSVVSFRCSWASAAAVAKNKGDNAEFSNIIAYTTSSTTFEGISVYANKEDIPADVVYSGFNTDYWDISTSMYLMPVFKEYKGNLIPAKYIIVTPISDGGSYESN